MLCNVYVRVNPPIGK